MKKENAVPGKNSKDLTSSKPILTTIDLKDKDNFLINLFEGITGFFEIREIDQSGKASSKFLNYDDLREYYPPIDKNVYIGMFSRKTRYSGKADNCKECRVLWADFDNKTLKQVEQLTADLKPGIIINSGHGIHTYWLLDKAYKPNELKPVLVAIANKTGSDSRTAEVARIMRLPGTYNVKSDPVKCELIEISDSKYTLEEIKEIYPAEDREIKTLSEKPCISNILGGVIAGHRNWALGRLTKHYQIQGYTKARTYGIIENWNKRNDPPEKAEALKTSFEAYWKTNYKLLGCVMPTKETQSILSNYCNRDKCPIMGSIGLITADSVRLDNRIFSLYDKISGYDLIVYIHLLSEKQGLSLPDILKDLTTKRNGPFMTRQTIYNSLEKLRKLDLIEVIKKPGYPLFAKAINRGNYGMGYTLLNYGSIRAVLNRDILPYEFKLYVLLRKYAFGKTKVWPSLETLGKELRIDYHGLTKVIKELDRANWLKRDYVYTTKGFQKLVFRLKV